jgi:hypothetical protein
MANKVLVVFILVSLPFIIRYSLFDIRYSLPGLEPVTSGSQFEAMFINWFPVELDTGTKRFGQDHGGGGVALMKLLL